MGGKGNLEGVAKRFVSSFLRGSANFINHVLGAGHGKAGAVGRKMSALPGNWDLLWTGLGDERADDAILDNHNRNLLMPRYSRTIYLQICTLIN